MDQPPQHCLEFSNPVAAAEFRTINDAVMGGVSSSKLYVIDGALRFEGAISLENNGGFASFRGPVRLPASAGALLVTLRGDGQRYKLTLKLDERNSTPQYQAGLTAGPEWTTIRFVPADFTASFRGRAVNAPQLVFSEARSIGILISDRQSGAFGIELRSIQV